MAINLCVVIIRLKRRKERKKNAHIASVVSTKIVSMARSEKMR